MAQSSTIGEEEQTQAPTVPSNMVDVEPAIAQPTAIDEEEQKQAPTIAGKTVEDKQAMETHLDVEEQKQAPTVAGKIVEDEQVMAHPETQIEEEEQEEEQATTGAGQSLDAEAVTHSLLVSARSRVLKACGSSCSTMSMSAALAELSDAEEVSEVVQADLISDDILISESEDHKDHKRYKIGFW